jgi:enolase
MAQAPLPNGTGGYQLGDGTIGEAILSVQGAPTALTAAATATAAQLAAGLFTFNGTVGNLTLPTVANLEEGIPSATKVNAAFDFFIINIDASGSDSVTLAVGTGWTIVGAAAVAVNTSGHFRARKTAEGAWTAYRIS